MIYERLFSHIHIWIPCALPNLSEAWLLLLPEATELHFYPVPCEGDACCISSHLRSVPRAPLVFLFSLQKVEATLHWGQIRKGIQAVNSHWKIWDLVLNDSPPCLSRWGHRGCSMTMEKEEGVCFTVNVTYVRSSVWFLSFFFQLPRAKSPVGMNKASDFQGQREHQCPYSLSVSLSHPLHLLPVVLTNMPTRQTLNYIWDV